MTLAEFVEDMETIDFYFEIPPDDAHRIAGYIRHMEAILVSDGYDLDNLRNQCGG